MGDFLGLVGQIHGQDVMLQQMNFLKHVLHSNPVLCNKYVNPNPAHGVS